MPEPSCNAREPFDVEEYIRNAPQRRPRFTEADLRLVAERAYAQGRRDFADYLARLSDKVRERFGA